MQVLIFQMGIYLVLQFMEISPLVNDYWWHKHYGYKAFSDAKKKGLAKWIATPVGYAAAMEAKKEYYDSIYKSKVSSPKSKKSQVKESQNLNN